MGICKWLPCKNYKSVQEYSDFQQINPNIPSYHLFWKDSNSNDENENDDVYTLLVKILEDETKGYIEPIFEYSKYTIKAFLNFINSDFKSYVEIKNEINKRMIYKRVFREYIQEIYKKMPDNEVCQLTDIKSKVKELILKENPEAKVNQGTLNAQIYMSIVNEKNRLHYGVKDTNHLQYDLFYYTDQTKKFVKKYNEKIPNIEVMFKHDK